MSDLFSLAGKTAVVTGASRGLGQAIAVGLAKAGADVVCASTRTSGTDDTAQAITEAGKRAWQVEADLSDTGGAQALFDAATDAAGDLHVLVNNAGTIRRHPAVEFPLDDWQNVVQTNLTSVFQLAQLFAAPMIERGDGAIINVASLLSFQGGITVPAYTASKHGVAGLTKALANEWAASGVRVNAIAPGYFRTDNTQALQENETRNRQILERIPAGRWGRPEDLAGAAVFLASPASAYVTGTVVTVDGGWMAR